MADAVVGAQETRKRKRKREPGIILRYQLTPEEKKQLRQDENNRADIQRTFEILSILDCSLMKDLLFHSESEFLQIDVLSVLLRVVYNYIKAWRYDIAYELIESYVSDFYTPYHVHCRNRKFLTTVLFRCVFESRSKLVSPLMNTFDVAKFRQFIVLMHKKMRSVFFMKIPRIPIPCESIITSDEISYSYYGYRSRNDLCPIQNIRQCWVIWFRDTYCVYRRTPADEMTSYLTWLPDEIVSEIMNIIYPLWRDFLTIEF